MSDPAISWLQMGPLGTLCEPGHGPKPVDGNPGIVYSRPCEAACREYLMDTLSGKTLQSGRVPDERGIPLLYPQISQLCRVGKFEASFCVVLCCLVELTPRYCWTSNIVMKSLLLRRVSKQ